MRMVTKIVVALAVIIILGSLLPILFPFMTNTASNISAMNGTDAGTSVLKAGFPIGILVVSIAIGVGLIIWAVRRMRMLTRGR